MTQNHALRIWREENGVTLVALASERGITASHLSEIERGKNHPSLGLADWLSRRTGIPLTQFVKQSEAAE